MLGTCYNWHLKPVWRTKMLPKPPPSWKAGDLWWYANWTQVLIVDKKREIKQAKLELKDLKAELKAYIKELENGG